ncbi:MAG: TatD family hydrolase [Proteobacteria bacterium]|nr:TatD family hydrolase [Pseudomonadota bacterium]
MMTTTSSSTIAGSGLGLFDSHAHVDGPEFDGDREAVLARARAAGVKRMIVIGAVGDPSSAERSVALAERDPDIWATVATHPHDAAQMTPDWWATHERLARHPRVVAIGETGLDYFYDHSDREAQRVAFARFIALARSVDKPVVCHIRGRDNKPADGSDAHAEARAILAAGGAPALGCVIHCFTGTPDDARAYAELGCYVSFSGIATYKTAQPIRDAVAQVPHDRILVETDCPYLAPIPERGKRNEPAFVVHTARVIAACAGLTYEDLARITVENTHRVFRIPT